MVTAVSRRLVGFACSYVPLEVIDAAGYVPWRVLPTEDCPDQAGQLLHDNLCPHVKRIVDRSLANDLPELEGMVFINSCDAMRRLADAWMHIHPRAKTIMLDLPPVQDEGASSYFAQEVARLSRTLGDWRGESLGIEAVQESARRYEALAVLLRQVYTRLQEGTLTGGRARMQKLYNQASTEPVSASIEKLQAMLALPQAVQSSDPGIPVFLFGNVLADPEVFALFEGCGAFIAGDDFCTGSRLFDAARSTTNGDPWQALAQARLSHPPCARTFDRSRPGQIAQDVLQKAQACRAQGVIGYSLKFCDPYLARLPLIRSTLRAAGLPVLLLEGDCTLRSIGQQRTRIEAFIEMLR
jgi:benzoyl-CoA reductase/2-hydroxyglutaryl-CoA dehydratase subunit BcrC/BadD/HgdB